MTSQERAEKLVVIDVVNGGGLAELSIADVVIENCRPGSFDGTVLKGMEERAIAFRKTIAAEIDAAVANAIGLGGIPGVELTDEQIREIEERYAKTTPGEWEMREGDPDDRGESRMFIASKNPGNNASLVTHEVPDHPTWRRDYDWFIAAHNQDLPLLLADRKRLVAIIRDMAQDKLLDIWKAGYEKGTEDAINAMTERVVTTGVSS